MILLYFLKKHERLEQFAAYMNKQYPNIRFSIEAKKNGVVSFLDIKI